MYIKKTLAPLPLPPIEKQLLTLHEDGAGSEEGTPCPSQSQIQSKCFEGKEGRAERRPQPQKRKISISPTTF